MGNGRMAGGDGIGEKIERLTQGDGDVKVSFWVERDSGRYAASATLRKDRPLRIDGSYRGRLVSEATDAELVRMAAQELVGIVEPFEMHVAPLEAALEAAMAAERPAGEIGALKWALDNARGRMPSPRRDKAIA